MNTAQRSKRKVTADRGCDVLIVDDEADIRELIAGILEDEGFETRTAGDSDSALKEVEVRCPTLVVLDIWLQGSRLDGLEILSKLRADHEALPVIMISGHGNIETAVSAMKMGAHDFIEKPFKADNLILTVERAIEVSRLRRENSELKSLLGGGQQLMGSSAAITQLRQYIDRVSPTGSRILITGPSGSGKELVARTIHEKSGRANNLFVAINAASMAPERFERELFGIEAAAGQPRKIGLFEQAHGGTLYIDEIVDMPIETQSKILRVLVEQRFEREGGGQPVQVDVRVISSSSKDLQSAIDSGKLREDLYHRLNVVPISVPPLSHRREDIPELIEVFIDQISGSAGLPKRKIGDDAMAALQAHNWPGNVRELRNNVERLLILATEDDQEVISADRLPPEIGSSTPSIPGHSTTDRVIALPLREAREMFEREYLVAQINRFSGNISRTAAFIGMERSALHRKLKSLGVTANSRTAEIAQASNG